MLTWKISNPAQHVHSSGMAHSSSYGAYAPENVGLEVVLVKKMGQKLDMLECDRVRFLSPHFRLREGQGVREIGPRRKIRGRFRRAG